ncbi:LysE family translocator [Pseudomonas sp. NA-150]|uniref:LysE family translocator n=1 Tax=Pseudomonas sp. NA-150 TaxID=3367525 RepID=UPI0037C8B989
MSPLISMAAFALACSISPGPVNIVALSSGAQFGFFASLRHVSGATVGFTLLLLLVGLGLHEVLNRLPMLTRIIQWAGVAFLLFLAWKLAADDGSLGAGKSLKAPSFLYGALMQWLNPKAWLASLAGMGAYVSRGDEQLIWTFAAVYFLVCYASIACWAYAGSYLRGYLQVPARVRLFNRSMALLLAGSAVYLLAA